MDYFFEHHESPGDSFWFGKNDSIPVNQSAFLKYIDRPNEEIPTRINNLNKRMIQFLKRNPIPQTTADDSDRERCLRHMMSERMRREKEKQSYLKLHSILSFKTKNEKNAIVQVAAKEVGELRRWKEELERENDELESVLEERRRRSISWGDQENDDSGELAKIKFRVDHPSSGIDSMLGVLKCLKQTECKTRAISSQFSAQELSAVLEIETKHQNTVAAQVEGAIKRTLIEVERKFRFQFSEGHKFVQGRKQASHM